MRKWVMVLTVLVVASVIVFVFFLRTHPVVPTFTFVNVNGQEVLKLKSQSITLIESKIIDSMHVKNSNLELKKKIGIVDDGATLYQFFQNGEIYVLYEWTTKKSRLLVLTEIQRKGYTSTNKCHVAYWFLIGNCSNVSYTVTIITIYLRN